MQPVDASLKIYRTGLTSDVIGDNILVWDITLHSESTATSQYYYLHPS